MRCAIAGTKFHLGWINLALLIVGASCFVAFVHPLSRAGTLLATIAICVPVHLAAFVFCGLALKLHIQGVQLFFGEVFGVSMRYGTSRATRLGVGWAPVGGWVKFFGMVTDEDVAFDETFTARPFNELHPLQRAAVAISGPILLLIFATLLIGPRATFANAIEFPQQLAAALSQRSTPMWKTFFAFVDQAPFVAILGVVAVKFAVLNLLPLPILNGGQALLEVLQWISGRKVRHAVEQVLLLLSLFVWIGMIIHIIYRLPPAWSGAATR